MTDATRHQDITRPDAFKATAMQAAIDLHVDLQNWFNAVGEADPAGVLAHFDPDFRIVSPAGRTTHMAQFASILPGLRGTRPGLVMEITDIECRQSGPDWAVVSYVERQLQDGNETRRISTVFLSAAKIAPLARWVHLQETWIAPI